MNRRRWLWVVLFVWVALLLGSLATGWNVVLVRDYRRMVEMARPFEQHAPPWMSLILGTTGFIAALVTLIFFFLKILHEMRINQQQSEFLATVSHELKTPIAALELASSLIRTGGLTPEEEKRLWASHQMELKRLREEVETLLEAARLQAGSFKLELKAIDLESWLGQSMERWRSILGPGSELRREGPPLPGAARVDLRTLNLITDNILDNARKFSRGAPQVVIHTGRIPAAVGRKSKPRWQLQFEDQGLGFDPNDSSRIFDRFFRGKTEAPYAIPGTGLGLYLAQSASRSLGLTLRGDSKGPGQGATFTLEGNEETPA